MPRKGGPLYPFVCQQCGATFMRYRSGVRVHQFCNSKCFGDSRTGTITPWQERFWSKVQKPTDDAAGCWLWTAGVNQHGYAHFAAAEGRGTAPAVRTKQASRIAWTLVRGPIQKGLNVLHRCDNPRCVNPDHLFLGTQQDNVNDMRAKGRDRHWGNPPVASHH